MYQNARIRHFLGKLHIFKKTVLYKSYRVLSKALQNNISMTLKNQGNCQGHVKITLKFFNGYLNFLLHIR